MAIAVDSTLELIRDKVEAGERLDLEDGLALMESDDLLALGELADLARRVRGGDDRVYFVQNINLYQTNVCRVKCKFCAFARTNKQEDAFTMTADEFIEDAVAQYETSRFTEIHCVNGENPHVGLDYYVELIRKLKAALPDVHLKFYTASEIHHMSKLEGCSHEDVLRALKDAGLGSMPRIGSASRRSARCSTATSRRTRSASTTFCGCASSRIGPGASSRSSRSRSIRRTPCSSGAASSSRAAPRI
jgi:aminodeoxyfutalosine synthase